MSLDSFTKSVSKAVTKAAKTVVKEVKKTQEVKDATKIVDIITKEIPEALKDSGKK